MDNSLIKRRDAIDALSIYGDKLTLDNVAERIYGLPSAQPEPLTCEGCKYEKNGQDLCYECCRGCGDMYEERKDNG